MNVSDSTPKVIDIRTGPASPRLSVTDGEGTIKISNLPNSSASSDRKSVNFGPGVDLLMNQNRQKTASPKSDINLSDLQSLDTSLGAPPGAVRGSAREARDKMLSSLPQPAETRGITLNVSELPSTLSDPPKISATPPEGQVVPPLAAATNAEKGTTWDGYKKFNEIPVNPSVSVPETPKISNEEMLKQKLIYLRRLEALAKKGIELTKQYTMEDSLAEMKGEYEMIKSEKEKNNSVKFQGKMLMAAVSAIEFLNTKFDPFDLKLDGWSESINENLEDYDDVFGELHEKYGGKAKMAPELKLLFMLGGSAAMIHMTNTMFKASMPGMDDIMRQNPELMQQFTQAAVNTMSRDNPGFGGFMSGMMPQGMPSDPQAHRMPPMGAPPGPPPHMRENPPRMAPGPPSNRPDIGMSRGRPTFADAENMESSFASVNKEKTARTKRPEMKGPSDINDILSGLKTKKVNIRQPTSENKSTISVDDLKDLQATNLDIPHKSKRKPRSERNTVTLNL